MSIIGTILRFVLERSARKRTLAELTVQLENSAAEVRGRIAAAAENEKNQTLARHIIGIERWSQRRLRTLLGEELVMDEYDGYRPEAELSMAAYGEMFTETREASAALARELQAAGIAGSTTVPHNDFGDFSVKGWLSYIEGHASRESGRF